MLDVDAQLKSVSRLLNRESFRYLCQRSFTNFNSLASHLYVCFPLELHVMNSTLTLLDTTVHELKCVDQTESTRNWDNKATQQLEKLNSDWKISAKTERLAVKGCYYCYLAISLSK